VPPHDCDGNSRPGERQDAPFTLTVLGLPVQICENGHRQFAQSKVALQRLLRLTEDGGTNLPIASERGRLFRRPACTDCGASLEPRVDATTDLSPRNATCRHRRFRHRPYDAVYRCRGCARRQLFAQGASRGALRRPLLTRCGQPVSGASESKAAKVRLSPVLLHKE